MVIALVSGCGAMIPGSPEADSIRLNQVGFYPGQPKHAIVVGAGEGPFFVTTPDLADTVFAGTLGAEAVWPPSGERVRQADFSALSEAGRYVLAVPGVNPSYPFEVRDRVHQAVAAASLKGFYYQRVSMPLEAKYAGPWARPAGHPDTEVIVHASAASVERPAGTIISSPRGWYDAGDYNKYIVNSGITMYTLMALYEHFPAYMAALRLDIPESDNEIPDILDEVLWNLRWMLTMQDPHDGGVYHKLTNPDFDGYVMPHEATEPRYVVQKGTAATLDFAAVMAQAARVFRPFEETLPGLADSCLTAAESAWGWARRHPDILYRQGQINQAFEPAINTGAYGDGNLDDEWRWAAAELYVTTRRDTFLTMYHPLAASVTTVPSWPDVGTLGLISLAHHRAAASVDTTTAGVVQRLIQLASELRSTSLASAYGVAMGGSERDFVWGSNAVAANQGMVLIQAFLLTSEPGFLEAALSNLDYLLGRNATGYSFVTGHGSRSPLYPHHRPSEADGVPEPVPGLIAGGPNPGQQDAANCPAYPSDLPALSYIDHVCSYASNEIAINWNAPMSYLAAAIEAIVSGYPAH
jgi:endoglucanase